ncbi:MAG: hypothetical protein RLY31_305 [Bacteroidota bacterium]|jgi:hypothetical protein
MENKKTAEQLAAISDIRTLVASTVRFPSVSGRAGIIAGTFALIGVSSAAWRMGCSLLDTSCYAALLAEPGQAIPGLGRWLWLDFGLVLGLSLSVGVSWALRKARRQRIPLRGGAAGRLAFAFGGPLVAGGIFCLALAAQGQYQLLAPSTLLFYGLALLAAGPFTLPAVRLLAWLEIVAGLVTAYVPSLGLIGWALGFGLFHLVVGGWIYLTHER